MQSRCRDNNTGLSKGKTCNVSAATIVEQFYLISAKQSANFSAGNRFHVIIRIFSPENLLLKGCFDLNCN